MGLHCVTAWPSPSDQNQRGFWVGRQLRDYKAFTAITSLLSSPQYTQLNKQFSNPSLNPVYIFECKHIKTGLAQSGSCNLSRWWWHRVPLWPQERTCILTDCFLIYINFIANHSVKWTQLQIGVCLLPTVVDIIKSAKKERYICVYVFVCSPQMWGED